MKNNKKTNNYVMVVILLIFLATLLMTTVGILNVFNENKKVSKLKGKVPTGSYKLKWRYGLKTAYDSKKNTFDYKQIDENHQNRNSVQGSAGDKDKIYYARAKSGKGDDHDNAIYSYDRKSKKTEEIKGYDKFYKKNTSYKANDLELVDNTLYHMAMDGGSDTKIRKGSKLVFKKNNELKIYSFNKEKKFINIAYNSSNDNFYTLDYGNNEIYKFSLDNDLKGNTISPNKLCNIRKIYYDSNGKALTGTYDENSNTVKNGSEVTKVDSTYESLYQGIVMKGYLMYVPRQREKIISNIKKCDGELVSDAEECKKVTNYIDVYDTRNCKGGNTINYSYSIRVSNEQQTKLKNSELRKFELESLFFYGSKLYLTFNNSKARGIDFYSLEFDDDIINSNIKASYSNNTVTLKAEAQSKYKIYAYKFCKNENGADCDYKGIKNDKGNYTLPKEINVEQKIKDANSDWYFTVRDLFGNTYKTKITKEQINKVIN